MDQDQDGPPPQHQIQEPSGEEEAEEEKVLPKRLRRLEFVRLVAAHAVVCLASLYGLAKGRAGPSLRPVIDNVESVVAFSVVPLCDRFRGTLLALLVFLDCKVDDMVEKLDRKLPPRMKAILSLACTAARLVPLVASEVLTQARRSGIADAVRAAYLKMVPVAKCLYQWCAPVVGRIAVYAWMSLNRLPLFQQAAQTAARWAERYNGAIDAAAGCLPTQLVEKFFSGSGVVPEVHAD